MTPIQLALLIFGIMLLLMVVRVPIAGAMFLAGAVGFILQSGVSPFLNFLNNNYKEPIPDNQKSTLIDLQTHYQNLLQFH